MDRKLRSTRKQTRLLQINASPLKWFELKRTETTKQESKQGVVKATKINFNDGYVQIKGKNSQTSHQLSSSIPKYSKNPKQLQGFVLENRRSPTEVENDWQKFNLAVKRKQKSWMNESQHQDIKLRSPGKYTCYVCNKYYHNYWIHISQKSHKQKIASSLGQKYMLELIDQFTEKRVLRQRKNEKQRHGLNLQKKLKRIKKLQIVSKVSEIVLQKMETKMMTRRRARCEKLKNNCINHQTLECKIDQKQKLKETTIKNGENQLQKPNGKQKMVIN